MKFKKTIDISESEIIREINETFSNAKKKNLIQKIITLDEYNNLDLDFLMTIYEVIAKNVIDETKGTGFENEAKDIKIYIQNLQKKLVDAGWLE